MAGTYVVDTPFEIWRSGTASNWIVYTTYNGTALITPRSGTYGLFRLGPGIQYIEIRGLSFEGQNTANTAIACQGCNHARFIRNTIAHMGAGGIASYPDSGSGTYPDYITADHNLIYHSGYNQGWSSGITYLNHHWLDGYTGFHSFITNNIISGMYDASYHQSDGNGIILDNSPGANTPAALIANNVVYENGRRCIHSRVASHAWIINNTCYKNGLALPIGEYQLYVTTDNHVINNIAYAWGSNSAYLDVNVLTPTNYRDNLWFTSGTGINETNPPSANYETSQIKHVDPLFVNQPYVSATGTSQYNNALPPTQITDQFHLQASSPAIGAGIDPATAPGMTAELLSGIKQYLYKDIAGQPRAAGYPFDLGAYAYVGSKTYSASFTPLADTYVDSSALNTNYGSAQQMKIGGNGLARTAFLKFDLSSLAGKTAVSAKLRLWVYNGASGTYYANSVADNSWTESGTTYINEPSVGTALSSVTGPVSDTWIELDVTGSALASMGQLMSVAITSSSSHTLYVDSQEEPYMKPQLVIQYR